MRLIEIHSKFILMEESKRESEKFLVMSLNSIITQFEIEFTILPEYV